MKLGLEQIQLINTLDAIAKVSARDCVVNNDSVIFMVPEEKMSQAIGKNGANMKVMTARIKKRIELFEYTEKPENFFEKAFQKAKLESVEIRETNGSKIAFIKADSQNKKIVLGNLSRLRKIKELAKRNYEIEEVRVR